MEGTAADRARVATASPEKSDAGSDEEGDGAGGGEALAKLKKKLKVALTQITNSEDTLHARIDLLKVDDLKKVNGSTGTPYKPHARVPPRIPRRHQHGSGVLWLQVCNVNSESINKLDERVKALEEK